MIERTWYDDWIEGGKFWHKSAATWGLDVSGYEDPTEEVGRIVKGREFTKSFLYEGFDPV